MLLLLALRAGLDRFLLAVSGLDRDLVRLGPFRFRQDDAYDAILKRGIGLAGIDLERQRHTAPELPVPQLVQVPGRALSLLTLRRGRDRSREGNHVLVDCDFQLLRAHPGHRRDDDRFLLRCVDIERQWPHHRAVTARASRSTGGNEAFFEQLVHGVAENDEILTKGELTDHLLLPPSRNPSARAANLNRTTLASLLADPSVLNIASLLIWCQGSYAKRIKPIHTRSS